MPKMLEEQIREAAKELDIPEKHVTDLTKHASDLLRDVAKMKKLSPAELIAARGHVFQAVIGNFAHGTVGKGFDERLENRLKRFNKNMAGFHLNEAKLRGTAEKYFRKVHAVGLSVYASRQ
ncbi:MAG: hypothetical protein AABX01_00010 [Candidatus Micrarchaeota archaeon]